LFLLENCLLVWVTMLVSTGLIIDLVTMTWLRSVLMLGWPMAAVALLVLPFVVRRFARGIAVVVPPYFLAALVLAFYWLLIGAAFVSFLTAFPELQVQASGVQAAGVYIFSWIIGYLALFAPQGIGVAEFVSGTLLSGSGAAGTILAFLVGFRLVVLVADLLSWAGGLLVLKRD
jgi:glycosyltransferase 2 family protein